MRVLLLLAALLGGAHVCQARNYQLGQQVPVYYNRVGPYHNPTETYQFYNLPFCLPDSGKEYKLLDLGEVRACNPSVHQIHQISSPAMARGTRHTCMQA